MQSLRDVVGAGVCTTIFTRYGDLIIAITSWQAVRSGRILIGCAGQICQTEPGLNAKNAGYDPSELASYFLRNLVILTKKFVGRSMPKFQVI